MNIIERFDKVLSCLHLPENVIWLIKYISVNYGVYIIWISLHYTAAQFYVHLCVPQTLKGFLLSPFLVPAPHCNGLRWVVYHGGNNIMAMWALLGTWFITQFIHINKTKEE